MGEFNSDDHYIYYCGQESLRRNGVAIIVNKSPKCNTWVQSQKWQNDPCSFRSKPFIIRVIQVCALTSNAEEAEVEWFYENLQDLLEITPKTDVLFIIGDWNTKVGSQVDLLDLTWSNRQIWPWRTEWRRAKANRALPRECTGHIFQQHKRRLYTWTSPDGQCWNQIGYNLCSWRWNSSIQLAKTRPGADCGSVEVQSLIHLTTREVPGPFVL